MHREGRAFYAVSVPVYFALVNRVVSTSFPSEHQGGGHVDIE